MIVLTTLAEKTYFLGFAALLNSIAVHGKYVDKIILGYRGELPKWLPALEPSDHGVSFVSTSGIVVELIKFPDGYHLVHEKPNWMKKVTYTYAPGADEYFFFDSDIVVNSRMDFFGEWVRTGVAICGDVNYVFPAHHPHRIQWARYAKQGGRDVKNVLNNYYNSGFLGWTQDTKGFIDDWCDAFEFMTPHSAQMDKFRVYDRTYPVMSANQDSLNLAAMITDQPIALLGPEAMGFSYGLRLMFHPIGVKPWQRNFAKSYLLGRPPRAADIAFWRTVNGSEVQPLNAALVRYKLFCARLFRFGARFYKSL